MKKYKILSLVLIAVMLFASGLAFAQTGIGREGMKWFSRVDMSFNSPFYPTLRVVNESTGPAAVFEGDVTFSPERTGGDLGAANYVTILPKIGFVPLGLMTNGTAAHKTQTVMDDSPANEWAAHNAHTVVTDSTAHYRVGAASMKVAFLTTAVIHEGTHRAVTNLDFTDEESVGTWMYCTQPIAAGDIQLDLSDVTVGHSYINLPAYYTANTWVWQEIDIKTADVPNNQKDVVTDMSLELSAAGAVTSAAGAFDCYFDTMWAWDATEEKALGVDILDHGVLSVMHVVDAAAGANTTALMAEQTDYIVHYEATNDFIVIVTDQSTFSGTALVAYK
jgi:hypothetical protein